MKKVAVKSKIAAIMDISFGSRVVRQSTITTEMEIDPSTTNTRKLAQIAAHDQATLSKSYDYSTQDVEAVESSHRIRSNRAVAAAQLEPAPKAGKVVQWLA